MKSHLEIGNEPSSGRIEAQAELPSLLVSHSPPPLGEGPSKDIFDVMADFFYLSEQQHVIISPKGSMPVWDLP